MPTFNDQDNKVFVLVPPGDYIFCVVKFESTMSKGAKTSGSDCYEMELEIENRGPGAIVYASLIDHPSCDWKIDNFIKCTGVKEQYNLVKGTPFEFIKTAAESKDVTWVNPLGLRGWCSVSHEAMMKNGQTVMGPDNKPKMRAVLAVFYTDKPKLPKREIEEEVPYDPFAEK
jgi:hypothetical protein